MRVAINGLFLEQPATGTGQYLRELAAAMRTLAPEDEFIFIAPRAEPSAPAPVLTARPRVRRENFAKFEFEQVTFPRAAQENRFDLAHVPHFGPPFFPSIPTVVTIHDLIPLILPAYRGAPRVQMYTRLAGWGARRARAVLADSEASARDIHKYLGIPRARIHVVCLAAHPRFQPYISEAERERVRARYNLPQAFALYLGGFDSRKNVARLVEAFAALEQQSAQLVLAGSLPAQDSDFFPDPRRLAHEHNVSHRVLFPGFIDENDKPALYALARVFLYPSHYEGFGLPPLEAMACGASVISSNASSLPEVVGSAGVLLSPDDPKAWREALDAILADEARAHAMRKAGITQARKFSWERAARETLDVYRAVV